ncbi:MAG: hypothetical protein ACOCVF_03120 [bacterium]
MRKTYDVQMLKEYANEQLARTDEFADAKFKSGICNMIEHVLLESNNYNGFQYIYGNLDEFSRIYY